MVPRDDESDGGNGWENWQSYWDQFSSWTGCGAGSGRDGLFRAIIPPSVETKLPDNEPDKQGTIDKAEQIDQKPSKPFYYVLPPALPPFNYYYLQPNLFDQQKIFPKYITSNPSANFETNTANLMNPRNVESIKSNSESQNDNPIVSNGYDQYRNTN